MGDNTVSLDKEEVAKEEAAFPLTDVDRWVLSQTDEEFHLHDWEELKVIIGMDELLFHILPFGPKQASV